MLTRHKRAATWIMDQKRRDAEFMHVQLRLSSWLLVRHNNVEKKKFLFRADRLGGYSACAASGLPWNKEDAVAKALESVDDCPALVAFLEMVA
jgi:hypothetical protein